MFARIAIGFIAIVQWGILIYDPTRHWGWIHAITCTLLLIVVWSLTSNSKTEEQEEKLRKEYEDT